MNTQDQKEILLQRIELARIVEKERDEEPKANAWECRHCLDVFRKPDFRFDYDYNQTSPVCPCCGEWL